MVSVRMYELEREVGDMGRIRGKNFRILTPEIQSKENALLAKIEDISEQNAIKVEYVRICLHST